MIKIVVVERWLWRHHFGRGWRNRNLCGEKLFEKLLSAHVSGGNVCGEKLFEKLLSAQFCELAPRAPPRSHFWVILRRFRLPTCARRRSGHDMCGEKLLEKLLSARVSDGNVRGETLFEKLLSGRVSASASRARKEPNGVPSCWQWVAIMVAIDCHHDGHGLPS